MAEVNVIDGDITQVKADALITAINSGGAWWGGIDGAIGHSSGRMFHEQAARAMPLRDGQLVYAPAYGGHYGKFDAVLFVVDELQQPLFDLVAIALEKAEKLSLTSVSLPTIRTGVMSGVVESRTEALNALARSVEAFASLDTCVKTINIVVYHNADDMTHLRRELKLA